MLNRFLLLACVLVIALGVIAVPFPDGAVAIAFVIVLAGPVLLIARRFTEEKDFITTTFLVALALRMGFGVMIHVFDLRSFFGGDALAYDQNGAGMMDLWLGRAAASGYMQYQSDPASGSAWGMNYLIGGVYFLLGRNIFAAQSACAVIGAATAPMIFYCSKKIYNNLNVAKFAALGIAIFPSFVIWSGQLLKDGLIIFLLVAAMTMVLQLQEKVSYPAVAALILAMFGILSLRFYIFYIVVVAVAGSFLIGLSTTTRSIARGTVIIAVVGFALMAFGVGRSASVELRVFGNLERVQSSRSDLARAANSGFGEDTDVSTTEGALSALPMGLTYLMLAPFPWQASNLRQAITIPEVLLWWAMIPLMIMGLVYTVRNKLRKAFPILIFSLMLTLAYSIFQGNVGTAYRQRTQIQVFLFILIGAGYTVYMERRENERMIRSDTQRRLDNHLRDMANRPQKSNTDYVAEKYDRSDID